MLGPHYHHTRIPSSLAHLLLAIHLSHHALSLFAPPSPSCPSRYKTPILAQAEKIEVPVLAQAEKLRHRKMHQSSTEILSSQQIAPLMAPQAPLMTPLMAPQAPFTALQAPLISPLKALQAPHMAQQGSKLLQFYSQLNCQVHPSPTSTFPNLFTYFSFAIVYCFLCFLFCIVI